MTFELLQSNIPVLAACPVVPSCNTLWGWSYMTAVANLDATFSDFGYVGDIVVLLQRRQDGLDCFHVAVQLRAERLQFLDALLVVAQLLEDVVQVGAGDY